MSSLGRCAGRLRPGHRQSVCAIGGQCAVRAGPALITQAGRSPWQCWRRALKAAGFGLLDFTICGERVLLSLCLVVNKGVCFCPAGGGEGRPGSRQDGGAVRAPRGLRILTAPQGCEGTAWLLMPRSLSRSPDLTSAPTLGTPASASELVVHTYPPRETPGLGS